MTKPPAIFLMGPTGAGKSDLAIRLAEKFRLGIVSVDSAMIYRGMDIGTAKPSKEQRQSVPHALIDIKDRPESYSAAEFRADALREMRHITDSGHVPLLVGGTGLYFRALECGISVLPRADRELRAEIYARAQIQGWATLHAELAKNDPQAAARIHPNDPQRIQRALEVLAITGRPISSWWAEGRCAADFEFTLIKVVWAPTSRAWLAEQLERRFQQMLRQGLVEECQQLALQQAPDFQWPSSRLVGYRQIWDYLTGRYSWDEMVMRAVTATRQLAKRQYTWFRAEAAVWFDTMAVDAEPELIKHLTTGVAAREL